MLEHHKKDKTSNKTFCCLYMWSLEEFRNKFV